MSNERKIFLVAQRDIRDDDPTGEQLYRVGVVGEIRQILRTQGDNLRVVVDGRYRGRLLNIDENGPFFSGVVEEYPVRERITNKALCDALVRTVKDLFEEYCYLTPKMPRIL